MDRDSASIVDARLQQLHFFIGETGSLIAGLLLVFLQLRLLAIHKISKTPTAVRDAQ